MNPWFQFFFGKKKESWFTHNVGLFVVMFLSLLAVRLQQLTAFFPEKLITRKSGDTSKNFDHVIDLKPEKKKQFIHVSSKYTPL